MFNPSIHSMLSHRAMIKTLISTKHHWLLPFWTIDLASLITHSPSTNHQKSPNLNPTSSNFNQLHPTSSNFIQLQTSFHQLPPLRCRVAGSSRYRMHPEISRFPSQRFYDGRLIDVEPSSSSSRPRSGTVQAVESRKEWWNQHLLEDSFKWFFMDFTWLFIIVLVFSPGYH